MTEFSYTDLRTWAQERLPDWQQDALRRIVEGVVLSEADVGELADMALAAHTGEVMSPKPVPPEPDHVLEESAQPRVSLLAIREIARVNALGPGPVRFDPEGLTVIYGGNAAGKSGLARILKRACSARDPGGRILPNVFERDLGKPAAAIIDFKVAAESHSHEWVDGSTKDPWLRRVNVFDARCAVVQVEESNRISYTPTILDLFRSLASVVRRVEHTLQRRKLELGPRAAPLVTLDLEPETQAGHFLQELSEGSDLDTLAELCAVSNGERERATELEKALASDPEGRATISEGRERIIEALMYQVSSASDALDEDAVRAFQQVLNDRDQAREAAEAARLAFGDSSELAGIGSRAWRALWESARAYSTQHAYPERPFPATQSGAACVFCQQPLTPAARSRLHSFEKFVSADVQQKADLAATKARDAVDTIRSLTLPRRVRWHIAAAGLAGSSEGAATRTFIVCARLRRRSLLRLAEGASPALDQGLPSPPDLQMVLERVRGEGNRYRQAAEDEGRKRMLREWEELNARLRLSDHADLIREEVVRLRRLAELDRAIDTCRTQPITLKRREAAESVLTDRLRASFEANLIGVGFAENPVEVALGPGEYGDHPVEMKLTARPEVEPEEILSEGERTCVALAGILAELETTGNLGALVLDDPITSLDHQYRKRVAERLVREAARRQVIILTHDIVFLYLLRKYQKELGVPLSMATVERGYRGNHGRATDGPPWIAMSCSDRIKWLRGCLVEARRALGGGDRSDYERRVTELYRKLRMSWERAVEEVLLYGTVLRFGDSVQTQRLRKLTDISDADIVVVEKEMSRCSDFAHDESGAVFAALPLPDVVEADIRRLDEWITDLRKNRGRH